MRRLYYTPGSPFGRAVRIIADELGLEFVSELANIKDSQEERARHTPTLQVPTLFDGDLVLWDSSLIADYLLQTYHGQSRLIGDPPLTSAVTRPKFRWQDQLLFATIQTLGQSIVMVSQMRWSGTQPKDNAHVARNANRATYLLGWLETQLRSEREGFVPGALSVQDIFAICHVMFMAHRPLDIAWEREKTPRLAALHDRLQARPSFERHAIEWWQPGMPT